MFNFRIITLEDGTEVIDEKQYTYENGLSPVELLKYIEWEQRIYKLNKIRQKELKELEQKRRNARNPFYKIAYVCGMM